MYVCAGGVGWGEGGLYGTEEKQVFRTCNWKKPHKSSDTFVHYYILIED